MSVSTSASVAGVPPLSLDQHKKKKKTHTMKQLGCRPEVHQVDPLSYTPPVFVSVRARSHSSRHERTHRARNRVWGKRFCTCRGWNHTHHTQHSSSSQPHHTQLTAPKNSRTSVGWFMKTPMDVPALHLWSGQKANSEATTRSRSGLHPRITPNPLFLG